MPSETFSHSATTSASRTEVWKALDDPATWQAIGGVDRVFDPVVDDSGRLRGFRFESVAAGMRYVGSATPNGRDETQFMAWDIDTSEIHGVTRVDLADEDGGTRIAVTLEVASVGTLSTMFFPVIAKAIGNGLPRAVDQFAAGFDDQS